MAYAKRKRIETAIDVLRQATEVFNRARGEDRLSILNGLCWLYLLKCREAPRVRPRMSSDSLDAYSANMCQKTQIQM